MTAVRYPHRLNLFQRMMLNWDGLHPYNPVHVVQVAAALDTDKLRHCIASRLEATGLTGLALDAAHGRFAWRGGPASVVLDAVAPTPSTRAALQAAIVQAFNRPFERGCEGDPFRFFVVDCGGRFHLGLAYDHFAAGGDAIAALLTDIALDYLGEATAPHCGHAAARPRTYRHLLWRHPGWTLRALAGLPRMAASSRRACRTTLADAGDARNGYLGFSLQAGESQALLASARAWGVTLNDLLLAALLQVLAPRTAARRSGARRNEIAVASIMNIRRDFDRSSETWPGPCLAALRINHAVPEGIDLRTLAQQVHERTAAIKRDHLYLQSLLALGVTSLVWPWLSPKHRHAWLPKHYPLAAGVTTLNLDPLWADAAPQARDHLDYQRAVPTGPLCPLVLAATTAHGRLHLGLAYRTTAYAEAEARALADGLHQLLLPQPQSLAA